LHHSNLMSPTLGFVMIVKNGGQTLRACLESVQRVTAELIVADTGSTDDSREIAKDCGATVLSIPWENDFAKARNTALAKSTADWVLTLDADEELDSEAAKLIPQLNRKHVGGYILPIRNYLPVRHGNVNGNRAQANDGRSRSYKDAPAFAEHRTVRLFRRHPQIVYRGCVHEAVAPQIVAAGFRLAYASCPIHHFGFLDGSERYGNKAEFYLELGRRKVEQEPHNALAWIELARQLYEPFRKNEEALACAARALALEPKATAAWFLSGVINLDLGRNEDAVAAFARCTQDAEFAAERAHYCGDALHNMGKLEEARASYRQSLRLTGPDPQVESKLGYVEVRLGDFEPGFTKLQAAITLFPNGAELHERLIKAYMAIGRLPEAAAAAETFASRVIHPKTILRAAAIRAHLKQQEQARSLIQRGLEFFPESPELRSAEAELVRSRN
jgi:glycosyltransferase involved in cell wall biosynthesis